MSLRERIALLLRDNAKAANKAAKAVLAWLLKKAANR